MGAALTRTAPDTASSSSDSDSDSDEQSPYRSPPSPPPSADRSRSRSPSLTPLPSPSPNPSSSPSSVTLYLHIGGLSPHARWIVPETPTSYSFHRLSSSPPWLLIVGSKLRATITPALHLKPSPDQRRIDLVCDAVWAVKFPSQESYNIFLTRYRDCLFENTHGLKPTEDNRERVFGKEFMAWASPEYADDTMWEDSPVSVPGWPDAHQMLDGAEEEASGIQSLALGALDNSFLVSQSGIQVVKNFSNGINGKGVSVKFSTTHNQMKKALLIKAETNMLLMGCADVTGVHQLDIETGKIVTEWRFEKDGTDIVMRDITSDSKGAQLDPTESTFLGLDDNRLCRWDMRDRNGMVQTMEDMMAPPVLQWTQGHQFARGTNFQCFATTGDGSIVVGSLDGKIRLYSKSSMRMAKTVFPGLASPITHVDVTFDGKWILGTSDANLILICTTFEDKDGKEKTGFAGRMGNRIAAPRLLKLTPLDSHLAGANKFQKGQFSWVTETGKEERHLVATIGTFSIIWNFQQVKNSNHECYQNQEGLKTCYCYRIVSRDEAIVDSHFMHDNFSVKDSPNAPLVVATSFKVSSFNISPRR